MKVGGTIIKISYSRFQSYLHCPYQHYLRYYEGLRLKKPIKPLYFGSDFHKLLELRGNKKELKSAKSSISDKFYEIPSQWQTDLGEDYVDNLFNIFNDYQRVYKDTPLPSVTEQPFDISIGKFRGEEVVFTGIIDELYDAETLKIGEHKTFSRKPDMDVLIMNTQKCLYAKATQLLMGVLPSSVIWDYICSKPPSKPVWLEKSGRFSSAKSTTITPYSWVRACREQGISDKEVIREGKKYRDNLANFYFRAEMDYVPEMVEEVWRGFIDTSRYIVKFGEKNKTKNFTRDCTFCNFRDVCHAECTGGNRDYVIEKNYEVHEKED